MQNIILSKNTIILKIIFENNIFLLLTDQPHFFAVLPIDQKINLVMPHDEFVLISNTLKKYDNMKEEI